MPWQKKTFRRPAGAGFRFRWISLAAGAALALGGLVAGGCAATPRSDEYGYRSELPWNTPQGWEGSPTLPGLDRQ